MKTAKLTIGILSMVLSGFITFQSCFAGLGNALTLNTSDTSGTGGAMLATFMLVAGIVGVVTRKSKKGGFVAGGFYALAAIIGFANLGTFGDLVIWSVLCLIFAAVFIIGSLKMKTDNGSGDAE